MFVQLYDTYNNMVAAKEVSTIAAAIRFAQMEPNVIRISINENNQAIEYRYSYISKRFKKQG